MNVKEVASFDGRSRHSNPLPPSVSRLFAEGWEQSEEGQAFYQLVLINSFQPSLPLPIITSRVASGAHSNRNLSADAQRRRAHTQAHKTVFRLSYLSPGRCLGPLLPQQITHIDTVTGTREILPEKTGVQSASNVLLHPSTYLTVETRAVDGRDAEVGKAESDGDNEGVKMEEENSVFIFHQYPHLLKPDYAYLAAARMVLEACLFDRISLAWNSITDLPPEATVASKIPKRTVLHMSTLELACMGSSPGFWEGQWMRSEPEEGIADGQSRPQEAPGFMQDEYFTRDWEEYEDGWDWAGVAGNWKWVLLC
jgi:hypothetical protein